MTAPRGDRSWTPAAMMALLVISAASACTDADKKPAADTSLGGIDTLKPLESTPVRDTPVVDTSSLYPPEPRRDSLSRGTLPPPGGETYKPGGAIAPRDQGALRDPPPNLIGETRRDGSTMSPTTPPRPRDSVVGPTFTIDSKGNISPIKR
ncbi:MAG TPA: hypothetical protein VHM24_11435 [Gemmatimonadaceae bacterium]|nr:hypothetical protein [Gemmatimonadaceae bacterium]